MATPTAEGSHKFRFDAAQTADANIESFLEVLRKAHPKLTALFEQHIGAMLPLSSDPAARAAARAKFNAGIMKAIEADK